MDFIQTQPKVSIHESKPFPTIITAPVEIYSSNQSLLKHRLPFPTGVVITENFKRLIAIRVYGVNSTGCVSFLATTQFLGTKGKCVNQGQNLNNLRIFETVFSSARLSVSTSLQSRTDIIMISFFMLYLALMDVHRCKLRFVSMTSNFFLFYFTRLKSLLNS